MQAIPRLLAVFLALGFAHTVGAQAPTPPPLNRDFDFWVGNWEVVDPQGTVVGTNRIERVSGGYGLLENWTAAGTNGGTGKSLNAYNASKKQWQQFWIGAGGGVLELAGGLNQQGEMVLSGRRPLPAGGSLTNRITWTPRKDGTVRQLWTQSKDDGATWTTIFDGIYRRK